MDSWRNKYLPCFGCSQNLKAQTTAEGFNGKSTDELLSHEDNVECISLNGMADEMCSENTPVSDQERAIQLKIAHQTKELREASEDTVFHDDQSSSGSCSSNQRGCCIHNADIESRGRASSSDEGGPNGLFLLSGFSGKDRDNDLSKEDSIESLCRLRVVDKEDKSKAFDQRKYGINTSSNPQETISEELSTKSSGSIELHAPINLHPQSMLLLLIISSLVFCYAWIVLDQSNNPYVFLMAGSVPMATLSALLLLVKVLDFSKIRNSKVKQVKWNLLNRREKVRNGIVTSPPFKTVTGCYCKYCRATIKWRLIIQREQRQNGQANNKYLLGLLAVNIPPEVRCVLINFAFSVVDQNGVDLGNCAEIRHNYTRTGDCAYSTPIKLLPSLKGKDGLLIQCKLSCEHYQTRSSWIVRSLCEMLGIRVFDPATCIAGEKPRAEYGRIAPTILESVHQVGCSMDSPINEFIRQCETQTFTWSIPCFEEMLKNSFVGSDDKPCVLYSPCLYVVSHGVCSMWSLKLFEFQGSFRVHAKLRGLPTGIKRLQMNYVFQVQDSFGDFIVPDECGRRIQSGDYMKLWDFSRHLLHSRQTLLERFIQEDGSLRIRISLNLEPLETDLSPDFADWVLFQ